MKIKQKLIFSNAAVLILALLLIIFTATSMRNIFKELNRQLQAGELIRVLVGFSVVTEDVIVFRYERTWEQWAAEYQTISRILSDQDIFPASVFDQLEQLSSDLGQLRNMTDVSSEIATNELTERLSSHIRLRIRGIIDDVYEIYDESTLEAGRLLKNRATLFIGYSILSVLILLVISITLLRRMTRTFGILINGAEKIIGGDLNVSFDLSDGKRVIPVKDEINELAAAFNTMTATLTRTLEELETEVAEKIITEKNLERALDEKTVLIQELYHRTKNNMQVIQSMLNLKVLQSGNAELEVLIDDVQAKIFSMSLVHEKLYQSNNLHSIDLKGYFRDLISYLHQSFKIPGTSVEYDLDMIPIAVPMETAVPCGIAVSELIMNSYKHASSEKRPIKIRFNLEKLENYELRIIIADDGPGLPEGFIIADSNSLGLKTVYSLIESQIGGKLSVESSREGLRWIMEFSTYGKITPESLKELTPSSG